MYAEMKRVSKVVLAVMAAVLLLACGSPQKRYVIGVSQCSEDIWREKLNNELQTAAYFYENIDLRLASAGDDDSRQTGQIDQFVEQGVDLLIVAPNSYNNVTAAIDRAYDRGIPVILFDRKTNSDKYTAYIGADNHEMGREMGDFIATQLNGRGRVVEVIGLKGSSPATERHNGFVEALAGHPGISLVASLQGDWTEQSASEAIQAYKGDLQGIDFVFGQNDRMAVGARKSLPPGTTRYCGIDGLPGKEGGIQLVCDSLLTASYIYPTRGDLVMALALKILEGKPYERENLMKSAIVTRDNAEVMLMQAEEMENQHEQLDKLHSMVDQYLAQYHSQQIYTVLTVIILLLVVSTSWYIINAMHRRHEMERETFAMVVQEPTQIPVPAQETDTKPQPEQPTENLATQEPERESPFLNQLRQQVQDHMADSDYGVEDLASDMALSRVQLYRKVKLLTGKTPVDIIRQSRLNRAKALLSRGDKTVSEVAYEVGFSAPSYFTKCFKDEFGISPSDL